MSRSNFRNLPVAKCVCTFVFALASYGLLGPVAQGQGQETDQVPGAGERALEEIIVTALKREQSLQEVPMTVNALSGDSLSRMGADSLVDYFAHVPAMNYAPNSFGERGGANIIIRGVSNSRLAGVDASGNTGTTAFFLGEVPITLADMQLFDIDRIEVLKGPQGTLYGQASMGGNVKVVLNRPDAREFEAFVSGGLETTFEGEQGFNLKGMVNFPLVEDRLAVRALAYHKEEAGFVDTIRPTFSDTEVGDAVVRAIGLDLRDSFDGLSNMDLDTNDTTSTGGRVALLFTPNEKLSIEPALLFQEKRHANGLNIFDKNLELMEEGSAFGTSENLGLLQERFINEPLETDLVVSSLDVSYDFGPVELVSISGYQFRKFSEVIDGTRGAFTFFGGDDDGNIAALGGLGTDIETDTLSQEIRLSSTSEFGWGSGIVDGIDWTIGAFYWDEERRGTQVWANPGRDSDLGFNEVAAAALSSGKSDLLLANTWDVSDDNFSVFGNISVRLTEKLEVSAGTRRFDQTQAIVRPIIGDLNGAPLDGEPVLLDASVSETGWTPKYGASYQATDDHLLYASWAEGFRAGGVVAPVTAQNCLDVVEEQGLESFAGGFGSDKIETYEFGVKTSWAQNRVTLNAAYYKTDWTDLQQSIVLSDFPGTCSRVLTANVGEAEVDGFEVEASINVTPNLLLMGNASRTDARLGEPDPRVSGQVKGARLQNVPEWQYSVSADYRFPTKLGEMSIRGDYSYIDSRHSTLGAPTNPLFGFDSYDVLNLRARIDHEQLAFTFYVQNALDERAELNGGFLLLAQSFNSVTNRPRTIGVSLDYRY